MDRLDALESARLSAKLRFEACWRVGDDEGTAFAMNELMDIDRQIAEERKHGRD